MQGQPAFPADRVNTGSAFADAARRKPWRNEALRWNSGLRLSTALATRETTDVTTPLRQGISLQLKCWYWLAEL